jgi:ribosomal protein S18 acetylase RimI-like enzyme
MSINVFEADFSNLAHRAGVVEVLDSYASDPVGGGQPLRPDVRARLIDALQSVPTSLVYLAAVEGRIIGVAVCFLGLSTFHARRLINIHDLAVLPGHRGQGVGRALLAAVEARARREGCCKLTLEVQDTNTPARGLYDRFGFADVVFGDSGPTRFLSKLLA